jgi:hypothetical protein
MHGHGVIREFLTGNEIRSALEPRIYLGTAVEQVGLMIGQTVRERNTRALL